MKQARTLDDREFRRVLDHVASRTHAARNRAMLMMTFYGGFRVGEVAQLKLGDVFDADGNIKPEIQLDSQRVKNKHARTVFLSERLRRELKHYKETLSQFLWNYPYFQHKSHHSGDLRPIPRHSTLQRFTSQQVSMALLVTRGEGRLSRVSQIKALV